MAAKGYELGAETSKLVKGTVVEAKNPHTEYNPGTGKYEESEVKSTLGTGYKGGSILGWDLLALEATEFTLYDAATEETEELEKATKIIGPIYIKEKGNVPYSFNLGFTKGIYCKVASGKLKGQIFCDIE